MNKTAIEWTTFSANPLKYRQKRDGKVVWACVKTSPGCAHCYSEAIAIRYDRGKVFNTTNMEELEPFLDEAELRKMRTAKTVAGVQVSGSRCFIGDMTDLFGEWVPDDLLNQLFTEVLERRTDVIWQLLTKRAERLQRYLSWRWGEGRIPCRNIHLGVSVERQPEADYRIECLRHTPAAVRFLSCEPLIGPLDFFYGPLDWGLLTGIHWVIVGSESGPKRRPMQAEWAISIREQCQAAGVDFFMKQMDVGGKVTGEIDAFPEPVRIRQFPSVVAHTTEAP